MWNFFGNAEFPKIFGRIARNSAETMRFHKISTLENYVKLRYFKQCFQNFSVSKLCENEMNSELLLMYIKIWEIIPFLQNLATKKCKEKLSCQGSSDTNLLGHVFVVFGSVFCWQKPWEYYQKFGVTLSLLYLRNCYTFT